MGRRADQDHFVLVDAECILKIPISSGLTDDFIAWHHTKNFCFSVSSAYYIEWENLFGSRVRRGDSQGSSRPNPVWDILWKLKIPEKVKIFIWKALHGIAPSM